jgi:hypothetical protein
MTQHDIRASLYAPLRVLIYENEEGKTCVEYDKPSSLFGQFGAPDPDGLASWQAAAQGGVRREALADAFLQSPEKQLKFVDGYYADFLGRAGEPSGVAAWMAAMQSIQLSPEQVAEAFLASVEFYDRAVG